MNESLGRVPTIAMLKGKGSVAHVKSSLTSFNDGGMQRVTIELLQEFTAEIPLYLVLGSFLFIRNYKYECFTFEILAIGTRGQHRLSYVVTQMRKAILTRCIEP